MLVPLFSENLYWMLQVFLKNKMLHRFTVLTGYDGFCLILFLPFSCLIVHVLPLIHPLHPSCFLVSICWKENLLTQARGQYVMLVLLDRISCGDPATFYMLSFFQLEP